MSKFAACAQAVRTSLVAGYCAVALIGFSSQVSAAEADATAEEEVDELEVVQVTGTRIQSPNVTASNPVTTITADEMRKLGMVNVSDALTQLVPQNISSYMPSMVSDNQGGIGGGGMDEMNRGSYFIGNTIPNLRGLDPTFGTRTLTLLDGRRVTSTSNQADVVDLNTIPTSMLQSMDVVTGGASATYGSGAVAGVVNLKLNTRMNGLNAELSYGINEAGDGASPSASISGGMPLFDGKAHLVLGAEWQQTRAIQDCSRARRWCRESRALFTNSSGTQSDLTAANTPLLGYEGLPARFEMSNVRYEQRWSEGALFHNEPLATSGFRFDASGSTGSEYAYGYRGGASGSVNGAVNGSGDVVTSVQNLLPSNNRKVLFSHFEYNLNDRTTAYFEARYANTRAENRNVQTTGTYCARFDSPGQASTFAPAQSVLYYTQNAATIVETPDGVAYPATDKLRDSRLVNATATAALAAQLGFPHAAQTGFSTGNGVGPRGQPFTDAQVTWAPISVGGAPPIALRRGISWPWWIPVDMSPNPPTADFDGWARDPVTGRVKALGTWKRVRFNAANGGVGGPFYNPYHANDYWLLESITLLEAFDGSPLVLPQLGRNSYAFLNNLSKEALLQVQSAFGRSAQAGNGNAGVQALYGTTPCTGQTAVRKLWNPQIWRETISETDTYSVLTGMKGQFGRTWKWDAYYQYGATDSSSIQKNNATNLRMAFAMDAVIDDRLGSPTYGQPICRILRDGAPALDTAGRPITDPVSLDALAADCKPLNMFGTTYSTQETFGDTIPAYAGITYNAAELQRQALAYAFVDSRSAGSVSQQIVSLNTNGNLWEGWAGPLTAAFGLELREDKADNEGTKGDFYARADLANVWADAFGGKTRVAEGYTEMNLPLAAGLPGVNLLAVNGAFRYGVYNNHGGAGTTGESATQKTPNWKLSATYEPFDWVRFRITRSRDLRAATYRELFVYQPGIPDEITVRNPWREGTSTSIENQQERYAQVRVGNSHLKPEKSDTLTLGFVLSPGGWASGLRLSVDYFDIGVRDGINTPFNANNPVTACFEGSNGGASADAFLDGGTPNPPNMDLTACKELTFNTLRDQNGNPIPGSMDLEDLLSYNAARPTNSLPYQRRGMDFNLNYNFPLNRLFESVPGSIVLNARATKSLESSGIQQTTGTFYGANPNGACGAALDSADPMNHVNNDLSRPLRSDIFGTYVVNRYQCVDLVGQIRSNVFIPGVAATPAWTGNLTTSYVVGDFTAAVLMRYIGGAKLDKQWIDDLSQPGYYAANGNLSNATVDNNQVKPYIRYDLNLGYDLRLVGTKQFRVSASIQNLLNKSPPFTGGGISGATAGFHDTLGRAYRFGLQAKF